MERQRVVLDNMILAERPRYERRKSTYVRREFGSGIISDIRIPSASKPQPKVTKSEHMGLQATKIHAGRSRTAKLSEQRARQKPKMQRRKGYSLRALTIKAPSSRIVLYGMAFTVFAVGIIVSMSGFRTNHQVAAQVSHLAKTASTDDSSTASGTAPSTSKPSNAAIANYVVSPDLPRYFMMPQYGITQARILPMGVDTNGALKTPGTIYDVGWYNGSSKPGQPGAVLLDAHVSSWTAEGVFYHLKDLKVGDTVQLQRGDGMILKYKVVKSVTYEYQHVDMQAAILPVTPGKPGLNMITCTGKVIPGTNEFDHRIVLFTEQV